MSLLQHHHDHASFKLTVCSSLHLASAYPPRSKKALEALHGLVCANDMSVPHKLAVFYYILLDYDSLKNELVMAESFAFSFAIPDKYRIFMQGLWLMDRRQFAARFQSQDGGTGSPR